MHKNPITFVSLLGEDILTDLKILRYKFCTLSLSITFAGVTTLFFFQGERFAAIASGLQSVNG